MSVRDQGEHATVLTYHGSGFRVCLGSDCWGTWAKVRWVKPRVGRWKIRFQWVTGGEYSSIVFEETFPFDPKDHGTLIRFPAGLSWATLERLYVVVKPIKD